MSNQIHKQQNLLLDLPFETKAGFDGFYHPIISDVEEAERYISWLKNESCYSDLDILNELKYQSESFSNNDAIKLVFFLELIKIENQCEYACDECGQIVPYMSTSEVQEKVQIGERSKVISRSLVGGSPVRQVTKEYLVNTKRICASCHSKYKKKKNKNRIIKGVLIALIIVVIIIIYC